MDKKAQALQRVGFVGVDDLDRFVPSIALSCDRISIADAAAIAICDNWRIARHRVFADSARRGKTSMGWFYGFKLHAIIHFSGELARLRLTADNVDDCQPMPNLCQGLSGQLFADKGYLARWLTETLARQNLQLITPSGKT